MSPETQNRIALQVHAARRANQLAVRFLRAGDARNAMQARILALRAIQQARDIVKEGK